MPLFLSAILLPLQWVLGTLLVAIHHLLESLGLPPDAGLTWLLDILMVLLVIRAAVLPLAIFATRNAQKMVLRTDILSAIRSRYAGQDDAESRLAKARDLRIARHASNAKQVKSLVPQLVQVPIFASLYTVLRAAESGQSGAGPLTHEVARSFAAASIGGVPLSATLLGNSSRADVIALGIVLTVVVAAAQFTAQALSLRWNITEQARKSPVWRLRPTPLFIAPIVVSATSLAVPLGLLFYVTASSLWTLAQQGWLLWRFPLPTTRAHHARQNRVHLSGRSALHTTPAEEH
jgi:YidC/Oxa1 family membrane protein insertase